MIIAEEASRLSNIVTEKQKEENFKTIIKDIDNEIQKAVNKGYAGITYDITRLVDTMKVREYLLSYGYECHIFNNDTGFLFFDINWGDPERARKEYEELIRIKTKFGEPLFKFNDLEEVK